MTSGPAVGARVAGLTGEPPAAPSFRVRVELPAAALAAHGVELIPMPLFAGARAAQFSRAGMVGKGRLALAARRAGGARLAEAAGLDAVLVHRRADPLPSLRLERRARRAARLVYDVDDAIWLDARAIGRRHPLSFLKGTSRKLRWLTAHADHVIAGNAILAEHLEGRGAPVSVVPSLVDTAAIAVKRHLDRRQLVLGWIGSASTAPFVAGRRAALERAAVALPDLDLTLLMVGGAIPAPAGVRTEARPWSESAERDALARMDVGLMPLPDTPWNRGKCAYKALQYMAAGVPVVTDDVGISAAVVGSGHAGLVPRGDDEWSEALVSLLRNRGLRERLGAEGRRRVERGYSLARWAPRLAAILSGEEPPAG